MNPISMDQSGVLQVGADQHRTPANEGCHFIHANDGFSIPRRHSSYCVYSPPNSWSVEFTNDRPSDGGCVVSALMNQTSIFRKCLEDNDTSIDCSDALEFLVHFIRDITQPLHCSGMSGGGNDIMVKFGNRRRNLHAISPSIPPLPSWIKS